MRGQRIKASRLVLTVILWSCVLTAAPASAQAPEGEMRWALYVTISPTWFDPGESGVAGLNSFWIGYALHDALVKPMPGNPRSPSLAESWTLSADRRVYEGGRVDVDQPVPVVRAVRRRSPQEAVTSV